MLKSLWSCWDSVTGLEPGDEGREDERGHFLDWASCLAAWCSTAHLRDLSCLEDCPGPWCLESSPRGNTGMIGRFGGVGWVVVEGSGGGIMSLWWV